ncbi:TonB-dependent siderophore receptor family protein, partial [Yersinia pestis PY-100]|jgi:hypothetical protein
MMLAR